MTNCAGTARRLSASDSGSQIWSDSRRAGLHRSEIEELIRSLCSAAKIAWDVGADFVDIKHCHGYLLHEFLSAHTRPGKFGGSFENRTRILREIVAGIRATGTKSTSACASARLISCRSARTRRCRSQASSGPAFLRISRIACLTVSPLAATKQNPVEYDLTETHEFMRAVRRARSEDPEPQRRVRPTTTRTSSVRRRIRRRTAINRPTIR